MMRMNQVNQFVGDNVVNARSWRTNEIGIERYRPSAMTLARSLRNDAAAIKDALVTAIAKRHPDRPYDVKPEQYAACRAFISRFEHIFTLNYDVLLYWAIKARQAAYCSGFTSYGR